MPITETLMSSRIEQGGVGPGGVGETGTCIRGGCLFASSCMCRWAGVPKVCGGRISPDWLDESVFIPLSR